MRINKKPETKLSPEASFLLWSFNLFILLPLVILGCMYLGYGSFELSTKEYEKIISNNNKNCIHHVQGDEKVLVSQSRKYWSCVKDSDHQKSQQKKEWEKEYARKRLLKLSKIANDPIAQRKEKELNQEAKNQFDSTILISPSTNYVESPF